MFINNKLVSLIYKVVLCVVCLVGILLNLGFTNGSFQPYVFFYYSILSNIFCLVFYIIASVATALNIKNEGKYGVMKFAPHFKGGVVMAMIMTMAVFSLITVDNMATFLISAMVHFVVPIMVIVDWALFDKKGRFVGTDPIIWTVIPFAYYCILLLADQFGVRYYGNARYPYLMLDPYRLAFSNPSGAWAPVLVNVMLIVGGYLVVGYLLLGIDRLLGNQAKKAALQKAEERAAALLGPADDEQQPLLPGEEHGPALPGQASAGNDGEDLQDLETLLNSGTAAGAVAAPPVANAAPNVTVNTAVAATPPQPGPAPTVPPAPVIPPAQSPKPAQPVPVQPVIPPVQNQPAPEAGAARPAQPHRTARTQRPTTRPTGSPAQPAAEATAKPPVRPAGATGAIPRPGASVQSPTPFIPAEPVPPATEGPETKE